MFYSCYFHTYQSLYCFMHQSFTFRVSTIYQHHRVFITHHLKAQPQSTFMVFVVGPKELHVGAIEVRGALVGACIDNCITGYL